MTVDPDTTAQRPAAAPGRKPPKNAPQGTPRKKTPLGFKIFGALSIAGGAALAPTMILALLRAIRIFRAGGYDDVTPATQVLSVLLIVGTAIGAIGFIVFGIRLVTNRRRGARQTAELLITVLTASMLIDMMIVGVGTGELIPYAVITLVLIVTHSYIDPSLSDERRLQRKLRDMETRDDAEEGTLGLDVSGRGYIQLDFFNLFWVFVIASIVGDIFEILQHMIMVDPGVFQQRAGMLWGPFSPIYGFGACLMTIALNRFHKANPIIIFLVSALIGGAFEYFVSWFLQFAFGVTAWDYSNRFLNIDGRTSLSFMCAWGVLGLVWIKLLLPRMLSLVNRIPWKWRYSVTAVCAALMIFNGAMTLISLDGWYSRLAGIEPDNAVMQFCAEHFDNDFMENRFQSMNINPEDSTRVA